jgi:hypothetical protein
MVATPFADDSHFRGAGKDILAARTALRVFVAVTGNAKYLPVSDDVRVVYDAWEYKDFRQGWLVEMRGGLLGPCRYVCRQEAVWRDPTEFVLVTRLISS